MMGKSSVDNRSNSQLIEVFEQLVDELLKPEPRDVLVAQLMSELGIENPQDPAKRIGRVREKMDQIIFESRKKK